MYDIIYADPPWDYDGRIQHNGVETTGSASKHYSTMKIPELKALDVQSLSNTDCLCFMWVTNPHLDVGIEVMKAWGFQYKTVAFVWNKMAVNPGYYTMSSCELCLVGKKGRIPKPRGIRNARQYLEEKRQKHSAKPSEVRKRIEEMFPDQKRIELFARVSSPGWDVWGNEAPNSVPISL